MPRGGPRPNSGPKKGTKYKTRGGKKPTSKTSDLPAGIKEKAKFAKMTPLDYMLHVMRDPESEDKLRAQMAYYAAPYIHTKADTKPGKKETRGDKAKAAGAGKFRASEPPILKAVK